jgi:hypothetical protein
LWSKNIYLKLVVSVVQTYTQRLFSTDSCQIS